MAVDAVTIDMERDAFFNGALVRGYQPYSGVVLRPDQTVRFRHMSLSAQGYRYYPTLNNVALSDGSPLRSSRSPRHQVPTLSPLRRSVSEW